VAEDLSFSKDREEMHVATSRSGGNGKGPLLKGGGGGMHLCDVEIAVVVNWHLTSPPVTLEFPSLLLASATVVQCVENTPKATS
jgi:hypothetical protein